MEFLLTQPEQRKTHISKNWILLDSESTCNIFCNAKFLQNIRTCAPGRELRIKSNGGGYLVANQVGHFPGFGQVHYHKNSVANVLSLSKVSDKYKVTFDNSVDNAFLVHGRNKVHRFKRSPSGLYFLDATKRPQCGTDKLSFDVPKANATTLVTTVKDNMTKYTSRQIKLALLARSIYTMTGRPIHDTFMDLVRRNKLRNSPVSVKDVHRSVDIFGPDIAAVRGKTVRRQPTHVVVQPVSPVPTYILEHHSDVELCVDICFINNVPFLATISRNIKLRTVDHVKNTTDATILTSLRQVMHIYLYRGFNITHIHADNGFRGLVNALLPTVLNICSAGEHVPEIERANRTLKERLRAIVHGLPYRRHNVHHNVTWLNWCPNPDSVSKDLSPRTIIKGDTPDYLTHCRLHIGSYCEIYAPQNTTNNPENHTVPAIALFSSGNAQAGYKYLVLTTNKVVTRHQWTESPTSAEIISDVEALAKSQDQPVIAKHGYHFSYARVKSFSHNFESVSSSDDDTEGADTVDDDVSHTSDTSSDSTYEANDFESDSSLPSDTEDILTNEAEGVDPDPQETQDEEPFDTAADTNATDGVPGATNDESDEVAGATNDESYEVAGTDDLGDDNAPEINDKEIDDALSRANDADDEASIDSDENHANDENADPNRSDTQPVASKNKSNKPLPINTTTSARRRPKKNLSTEDMTEFITSSSNTRDL